jgi:hypothetical protein
MVVTGDLVTALWRIDYAPCCSQAPEKVDVRGCGYVIRNTCRSAPPGTQKID